MSELIEQIESSMAKRAEILERKREAEELRKKGAIAAILAEMESRAITPEEESRFDAIEAENKLREYNERLIEVEKLKRSSGIPERYITASLRSWTPDNTEQETIHKQLLNWFGNILSRDCPSVIIQGAYGTGKTWVSCGIVNDLINDHGTAQFITAKGYTEKIKESYRKNSEYSESQIRNRYSRVDLLVLDEIGRQFDSDSERLYFFDLINERYNAMKPTLLITNLDSDQVAAFLGEAIIDRFRDASGEILSMNWTSRRG